MRRVKVSLVFEWKDMWIGFFYNKKKSWLYFLPIPCIGLVFKFPFKVWMEELKEIAFKFDPVEYSRDRKWMNSYFKRTYYDKGFTPTKTWMHYYNLSD